ncbi:Uma2 family endonuclease [Pendulispora albinea]|uniref:Uma2 family endonuclease n=1 Tax=Pendulispora albinea TaxID=2741071 RepID=A0ABZ2M067_9BACT
MVHLVFESNETIRQEDFARFVEEREAAGDVHHYELLNGRVVMAPPEGYPHGSVGSTIQALLGTFVQERDLGKVFDPSQGFELPPGDTIQPDHSFVSAARWRTVTPVEGQFLRVVPDLIAEVLSQMTRSRDRGEKKAIYERNGVREYWLVDPRARSLTVFQLRDDRFDRGRTFTKDDRYEPEVLRGLSFTIGAILP